MRLQGCLHAFPGRHQHLFITHIGDIAGRKDSRYARMGLAVNDDLPRRIQCEDVHGKACIGQEANFYKDAIDG